ncbi:MAG TPA: hypothetical protein VN936_10835, partial [Candidatus Acidoferrum sp.]|nr:hypothetical protein [Candidatus Acidoferrum sp.]
AGLSNALGIATTSKAGAPYSLVQETHRSSTLADGTHIEETSRTAHMYRDSQGRTRMEVYISMPHGSERAPELAFVTIIDPVAGKSYSLNPHTQTATETGFPFAGTLSRNAPTPSVGAGSGVVFQTRTPAMAESAPQMTHESLGPQEMDGVTVTGTRFTQTFPVGSIGNDRPIVVVRTIWHSEELGIDMLGEVSDPRTGNVTTRVTQLDRTEPDPALFQVPADYQITEAPARQ